MPKAQDIEAIKASNLASYFALQANTQHYCRQCGQPLEITTSFARLCSLCFALWRNLAYNKYWVDIQDEYQRELIADLRRKRAMMGDDPLWDLLGGCGGAK